MKIHEIKKVIDYIKEQYGTCDKQEPMCWSCQATHCVEFLESHISLLEDEFESHGTQDPNHKKYE